MWGQEHVILKQSGLLGLYKHLHFAELLVIESLLFKSHDFLTEHECGLGFDMYESCRPTTIFQNAQESRIHVLQRNVNDVYVKENDKK